MAHTFNSKAKHVASTYKDLLKIKVTDSSLKRDIEENPFFPSLLSISDTFDRYRIPNSAYEVPAENFDELEAPFIALVDVPAVGNDFTLVTAIDNNTVSYLYEKNKSETIGKEEFIKRFKNVVFMAEPGKDSGETNYVENRKKERTEKNNKKLLIVSFAIIGLCWILGNVLNAQVLPYGLIAGIKLAGLSCAVLLLAYDIDKGNAFVKNICTAGAKTNCDAVLGSKAAKIAGISWAEIGFFYFAFTTLLLLNPGMPFEVKTGWLALINVFAAPYILFSIYYQWRVIKQWCPLCLTVQTVLAAELIYCIAFFWLPVHSFSFLLSGGIASAFQIVALAFTPIIVWYALKPLFLKANDYVTYRNAYKRLQYNPDIFNSLLVQQPKAADNWQELGINIGNPTATNTVIKVCNPYCGPCAKAHPKLEELIAENPNINLKVIFTARNHDHDRGAEVVRHLLAVAALGDGAKTQQALDDWYLAPVKDYKTFAEKYPMNGELKMQNVKLEAMRKWCDESEVTHTPTIFVNGYRLPENYDIKELQFIL